MKLAMLQLIFLGLWLLWYFGLFAKLYEHYFHWRHKPKLSIRITGRSLPRSEDESQIYHFITDYTEHGWPLKGGEEFTKEQYDVE